MYFKVLKGDLTSIGLRGCKPIQYRVGEWIYPQIPEKIHFSNQSVGGLNACKTRSGVKWLRGYVKEKYGLDTVVFECEVGQILYESRFKIETDKIRLTKQLGEDGL